MINAQQVHSLTEFIRHSKDFVDRLDTDRSPVGLTVNGKVRAVLVDPETFEEMHEARERERFLAALREGIADVDAGRVKSADEAYGELKAKYGL